MKCKCIVFLFLFAVTTYSCGTADQKQDEVDLEKVQLVTHEKDKKVDIIVDGQLFTSYIYSDTLEKPVLYPIKTASGTVVTRGYPLDKKAGERYDHPHHIGLWFNYGNVNGIDFWNNSSAIPEDRKHHYGTIVHRAINEASGGKKGVLKVTMDWINADGEILLQENATYAFLVRDSTRIIDRTTRLTAQDDTVSFYDNKEGMIAVRVTRALELPTDQPVKLTNEKGMPDDEPVVNDRAKGDYLSSEGKKGNEVWGTRAKWVKLYSTMKGEEVSIVILDHPENIGYPTYWHARGYGLFSANPLGQKVFSEGKEELDFKLPPEESVTFNHRIIIHSGSELTPAQINEEFDRFTGSL